MAVVPQSLLPSQAPSSDSLPVDDQPPSTMTNVVNFEGPDLFDALLQDDAHANKCRDFFLLLALCHTVVIEEVDGNRSLSASSPDELALVSAGAYFGYEFIKREHEKILIRDTRRHSNS